MKALIALVPLLAIALAPSALADPRDMRVCTNPSPPPDVCVSLTLIRKVFVLVAQNTTSTAPAMEIKGVYGDLVASDDGLELFRGTILLLQNDPLFNPNINLTLASLNLRLEKRPPVDFISMDHAPLQDVIGEVWLAYLDIEYSGSPGYSLHYQVLVPVLEPPA
jgi:hypothetical protein